MVFSLIEQISRCVCRPYGSKNKVLFKNYNRHDVEKYLVFLGSVNGFVSVPQICSQKYDVILYILTINEWKGHFWRVWAYLQLMIIIITLVWMNNESKCSIIWWFLKMFLRIPRSQFFAGLINGVGYIVLYFCKCDIVIRVIYTLRKQ